MTAPPDFAKGASGPTEAFNTSPTGLGFSPAYLAPAAGAGDTSGNFTQYTPVWASSGTQPAIGNGTINGRYLQLGKLVYGTIVLTMGSTTTYGTGSYTFTRPITAQANNSGLFLSSVDVFDSSAGAVYKGALRTGGTAPLIPVTLASPTADYAATVPVTFATSDTITIAFLYEAA